MFLGAPAGFGRGVTPDSGVGIAVLGVVVVGFELEVSSPVERAFWTSACIFLLRM